MPVCPTCGVGYMEGEPHACESLTRWSDNLLAEAHEKRDAVRRARSILAGFSGNAADVARRWAGFNALYNSVAGRTERDRMREAVQSGITNEQALRILHACSDDLKYLLNLPPGDMRRRPTDPQFRARAARDLAIVTNVFAPSRLRLSHLVAVIYQIRCNLVHGAKDPTRLRSDRLLGIASHVTELVLDSLLNNAETSASDAQPT